MTDMRKWLAKAIDTGIAEWTAVRESERLPAPDEVELAIYRLGFAAGSEATLTHISRVLARED